MSQGDLFAAIPLEPDQLERELLHQLRRAGFWFHLCDLESYVAWYGPSKARPERPAVLVALARLLERGMVEHEPSDDGDQDCDGWRRAGG